MPQLKNSILIRVKCSLASSLTYRFYCFLETLQPIISCVLVFGQVDQVGHVIKILMIE